MQISKKLALKYSRQINLAGFDLDGQERLFNSHVLVIGAGGLGCAVCQSLASSGVGQITLVDHDTIDLSNIPRQILYQESDIGKPKVVVAKYKIESQFQETNITIKQMLFEEFSKEYQSLANENENDEVYDLVLDCTDNQTVRLAINAFCVTRKIPFVSGAAVRMQGQLFCYYPDIKNACYHCLSDVIGEQSMSCADLGVLSPLVGMIGNLQAIEAIKYLSSTDKSLPCNTLKMYDGKQGVLKDFGIRKLPNCKTCHN